MVGDSDKVSCRKGGEEDAGFLHGFFGSHSTRSLEFLQVTISLLQELFTPFPWKREVLNSASEPSFAVSLVQTGERTTHQRGEVQGCEGGAASVPRNGLRLMETSRGRPPGAEPPNRLEGSILDS